MVVLSLPILKLAFPYKISLQFLQKSNVKQVNGEKNTNFYTERVKNSSPYDIQSTNSNSWSFDRKVLICTLSSFISFFSANIHNGVGISIYSVEARNLPEFTGASGKLRGITFSCNN